MNATEILVLAGVAVATVTTLLGGLIWIVNKQVATLLAEHKPNGGSSMKDQLNRIESDVNKFSKKLDDHITWHLDH
jgi:hypothetical protein|tara:strand:+ start:90 stop:317 length:228 start_codon:yes stop_codon:yes gene_type:complete